MFGLCFWRMKGFFLRLRVIDATAPKPVIFSTSSFPRLLIQGDGIAGYSSNLRFSGECLLVHSICSAISKKRN